MVIVDGSLVIQIVNFLLLIWILNMVLYKPIRKILLERKAKVEGMQSAIDGSAEEVQSKEAAYAEGVRQARAAGQKEKEVLLEAAAEEEKAIIGKINESAGCIMPKLISRLRIKSINGSGFLFSQEYSIGGNYRRSN